MNNWVFKSLHSSWRIEIDNKQNKNKLLISDADNAIEITEDLKGGVG